MKVYNIHLNIPSAPLRSVRDLAVGDRVVGVLHARGLDAALEYLNSKHPGWRGFLYAYRRSCQAPAYCALCDGYGSCPGHVVPEEFSHPRLELL